MRLGDLLEHEGDRDEVELLKAELQRVAQAVHKADDLVLLVKIAGKLAHVETRLDAGDRVEPREHFLGAPGPRTHPASEVKVSPRFEGRIALLEFLKDSQASSIGAWNLPQQIADDLGLIILQERLKRVVILGFFLRLLKAIDGGIFGFAPGLDIFEDFLFLGCLAAQVNHVIGFRSIF